MNKFIKSQVMTLLQDIPFLRDDAGETAEIYAKLYFDGTPSEFIRSNMQSSISRQWRQIQQQNPELRGNNYDDRHKTAQKIRCQKARGQELPEDFRKIYDEHIYFEKETAFQYLLRRLFHK